MAPAALTIFRRVNLRHLMTRRQRALLTIAGIAASVCLVVAISVVNTTLRESIDGTMRGLAGAATLELTPAGIGYLDDRALRAARRTPGVEAAIAMTRDTTRIGTSDTRARTLVFGIRGRLEELFPDGIGSVDRRGSRDKPSRGLLVSSSLARTTGARGSRRITMEVPGGTADVPVRGVLVRHPFATVNGGAFAVLGIDAARKYFRRGRQTDTIYVKTSLGADTDRVAARLRRATGAGTAVRQPGHRGAAYRDTFDSIAAISEQARWVALVVALLLVVNTMSMSLVERREEIVLLATGGARHGEILAAFVAEAAILGLVGGAIGIAGGVALGDALVERAIADYAILPLTQGGVTVVDLPTVLLGLAAGLFVAVAGAGLLAGRILRVKPMDVLRPVAAYEWRISSVRWSVWLLTLLGLAVLAFAASTAASDTTRASQATVGAAFAATLLGATLLLPVTVSVLVRLVRWLWSAAFGAVGQLAADALRRNPRRTTLTAGSLAAAGAVVVAVGSGIGSYEQAVERAASAWYHAPLFVNAGRAGTLVSDQPLPGAMRRRLERIEGVKGAYPLRLVLSERGGRQLIVYAMPVAEAAQSGDSITTGLGIPQRQFVALLDRGEIALSRLAAKRQGIETGDFTTLAAASSPAALRVGGFFNDITSFESMYIERSRYVALTGDTKADRFAVTLEPGAQPGAVQRRLRAALDENGSYASVQSRANTKRDVLSSIEGLFSIAKGVQAAALLVAALVVLNTMITVTFERRFEFGVERMLGMSRRQLSLSIMLEAAAVAVIGAIAALIAGLSLGLLMISAIETRLAWDIAFSPDAGAIAAPIATIVAAGGLAALYPSLLATRLSIVKLIRFE